MTGNTPIGARLNADEALHVAMQAAVSAGGELDEGYEPHVSYVASDAGLLWIVNLKWRGNAVGCTFVVSVNDQTAVATLTGSL